MALILAFVLREIEPAIEKRLDEFKNAGKSARAVEITNISGNGVWLLAEDKELFMSYDDFPWFRDAPVREILNVEEPNPGHFYWPDLDVDLTAEIIEHPERFPLKMHGA